MSHGVGRIITPVNDFILHSIYNYKNNVYNIDIYTNKYINQAFNWLTCTRGESFHWTEYEKYL